MSENRNLQEIWFGDSVDTICGYGLVAKLVGGSWDSAVENKRVTILVTQIERKVQNGRISTLTVFTPEKIKNKSFNYYF